MKKTWALALGSIALVTAAGCSGGDGETSDSTVVTTAAPTTTSTTTTTSSTTTTSTIAVTTTTLPIVIRQPLTGIPVASETDVLARPALAVKIDNSPPARRNHSGLAVADIVYEEQVEGGITRFAAVFHSTDADPIGPIRSGRSQDIDILTPLDRPLFAWSGGNGGVTRLVRDSQMIDLNYQFNTGSYYRGPGSAPHNVYSSTDALYALAPDDAPTSPRQQFAYLPEGDSFAGEPASAVALRIGGINIGWDWNSELVRYERSQGGSRHVDKTYGQIGAENIVVFVVDYRPSVVDRNSPEAQTVGEGPAFVFSNGQVVRGSWSREASIYPFTLVDDDGDPIELTPGQTWVELANVVGTDDAGNPRADLNFS